ncbi:unnamed protein product [Schistocephalus solidus]|uniref:Reverse transcriptase domain-containing protein n=1 Tax=Schistocephalus solidus TaxID=70667 RepID=A0A183STF7_SCHSO|nr:unnamed protein product [Schistocephalus solidus]
MIRVLLQDCHASLRKYRQGIDQETARCCVVMGEDGRKLLQQRVTELARQMKATCEAAPENKLCKLPHPTSSQNDILVHNLSSKELTKEPVQVFRNKAYFNRADAKPVDVIAALDFVINQMEAKEETKNLIRHQVPSFIMAHKPFEILPKVERDALTPPSEPVSCLMWKLVHWLMVRRTRLRPPRYDLAPITHTPGFTKPEDVDEPSPSDSQSTGQPLNAQHTVGRRCGLVKIFAHVLLNRLNGHLRQGLLLESQRVFRRLCGTAKMIFTARQLQEKCQEMRTHLYTTFVDRTKAFDTVNRDGLWKVTQKFGCH